MYIADLHIHSHYSRATSKDSTLEYLDLWARRKGISILGTGDFTHPAWREELKEKLEPDKDGFYVLKEEYRIKDSLSSEKNPPHFVVTGEISSIYKTNDKVHKVHSLLILPSLEDAQTLSEKLETIGNIHSDGRPILGLDCRDLLEIMLEVSQKAIYVPAHIWTPHFSLFGAFSGFDSFSECYRDMTPYVHAIETGLSSDPPMNWRLSMLDGYQLISNSDAHSPSKLGREANLMDISLSYEDLYTAIQTGKGLYGTIEFFPEEGKYHFDGHRKCNLCLSPKEAEAYHNRCPVCGKKLTTGVLHRVEQLADRDEQVKLLNAKPFESLVPLPEVIAASTGRSEASVKVKADYETMLQKLGTEFSILREIPLEDIKHISGSQIAEGIKRLREGKVERTPGFDGEYGTIHLLKPSEIDAANGQLSLFSDEELKEMEQTTNLTATLEDKSLKDLPLKDLPCEDLSSKEKQESIKEIENEEQLRAKTLSARAIAVIAGPGTGKTKTLVNRILYLLENRHIKPEEITAVTFTNRAADEILDRLSPILGKKKIKNLTLGTFHSISNQLLKDSGKTFLIVDELEQMELAKEIITKHKVKLSANQFLKEISLKKSGAHPLQEKVSLEMEQDYKALLESLHAFDFDDLLIEAGKLFDTSQKERASFRYLLVDEFQDISPLEYSLIQSWNQNGKELFVIGDPNQAIYSFRGSDSNCFTRLKEDFPDLEQISLKQNYRSTPEILSAALSVISHNKGQASALIPTKPSGPAIRYVTAPSELSEGIFIAKEINRLIGGIDMLEVEGESIKTFSDIAVLYRTHKQAAVIERCLKTEGIPFVVVGRDDFLKEDIIRGSICFFHSLLYPEDTLALRLCLKLLWQATPSTPPLSYLSLKEHFTPLVAKKKPHKLLEEWKTKMDLMEQSSLKKLIEMAAFHKTMESFLQSLSFGGENDLKRGVGGGKSYLSDVVTLMTLHGAKGLEFPVCFLSGFQKGMIPLEIGNLSSNMEEERRLFYVGITRAKEELILLSSGEPSPFLEELPSSMLHRQKAGKKKQPETAKQMTLFDFL